MRIRGKTVNIQKERKNHNKLQFLGWIKTLQYPHRQIHQFTTLHYFITTLHKKGLETPLRLFSAWEAKTTL